DRVTQLFVHGPAERDDAFGAGFAGGRGDAGQAGQRVGGGEPAAGVADLGEQSGGADGAGPGQVGVDLLVRVGVVGVAALLGQDPDLGGDGGQGGQVCAGDAGQGLAVGAGGAAGCGGDAGVQRGRVGAAAVADAGKPGGQPFRGEPVEVVLSGEAGQE